MTAAVSTFEVVDLVDAQAAEFATERSRLVRERSRLARVYRLVPQKIFGLLGDLFAGMALAFLNRHARWFAHRAVWFRGAQADLENLPLGRLLDPDDHLRTSLDRMESGLAEIVGASQRLAKETEIIRGRRGMFSAALLKLAAAADEMRQEVRHFKGALQAHDANVDAIRRARRICSSPSELDEALDIALL